MCIGTDNDNRLSDYGQRDAHDGRRNSLETTTAGTKMSV
jgi:hypothetical protein